MEKNIHQLHQKRPESSKLKKMKEIVDNCSEQIVIFSRFKVVLKSIKDMYPEACLITGATSRANRKKAIDQFQTGASKIFLLSIHCASVGITLTSGSHMIFMEPILDKNMKDQAIGRINRTGQSKKICIHTLMNDTIDLWMHSAFKKYNSSDTDKEKRHFFREETINYLL
jgi:SNF2 family DNA or RNA helicase